MVRLAGESPRAEAPAEAPPSPEPPDGAEALGRRLRGLERELARVRRSRRVLMDLLWRLDHDWRCRLDALEAENRRLWAARRGRAPLEP